MDFVFYPIISPVCLCVRHVYCHQQGHEASIAPERALKTGNAQYWYTVCIQAPWAAAGILFHMTLAL
jgi:hypothetical protein